MTATPTTSDPASPRGQDRGPTGATTARLARSHVRARDVAGLATVGPRTRKLRGALTTIGIAFGIATIVAVLGIAESTRAHLLAQLDRLGTNHLEVRAGQSVAGGSAALPATTSRRVRRLDPVDAAAATTTLTAPVRRTGLIPPTNGRGITATATDAALARAIGAEVADGRWHDAASITLPTVVVGAKAAERLGVTDVDGRAVVIGDELFTVIGILRPIPLYATLDAFAFIGYPAAADRFPTAELAPTAVYVTTLPDATDAVHAILPATVNPLAPEEVAVSNPSDALAAKKVVDDTLTTLLLALGSIALLVGGIGIANVMVIGVLERRTEIGVRRAVGATRGHIRIQFLLEAALLGACGGVTGAALGTAATYATCRWRQITLAIPHDALLLGIAAAIAIGALAGLSPATRAARLPPADAIRPA